MRHLFPILFAVAILATPLAAADAKPFNEMTLQELQAVDTKALDKVAKKEHKKALKAAKSAEKARIKAERKAEEARLKAEKKRRKEEKKAIKKHNKAVDKVLAQIDRTFQKSNIYKDDFEAYTRVSGPYDTNDINLFGVTDYLIEQRFWLEAFYDPYETSLPVRLYISDQVKVQDLNENTIGGIRGPVENYLTRRGYWNNFVRATLRGGAIRQLQPSKRYLDNCTIFECYFREEFYIELSLEDMGAALSEFKGLEIKVADPAGEHYIFSLPFGYMLGYAKRFGEIQTSGPSIGESVTEIENSIRTWKRPLPSE